MAEVALVNLSKTYEGPVEAVRGLHLRVRDGELMVLVGPSGSGKSTVLRLVAGLEEITAGEIRIGDRLANRLHPKDRDVAMVFQDYALYPHMTVEQNIGFSLRLRRAGTRDEVRARVERVAELLGISDLLERRPQALSGGQQQRVALARAIVREPAAFLFDEPLSNLDARLRLSTRSEIKALQRRLGTTTIYVTHDQEEAMSLGDRLAVLCDGLLQQVGTPLEVYTRPANRFVASFIGSPPMNLLEGRLEESAGGLSFVEDARGAERLSLPDAWRGRLAGHTGPGVLGFRPQALREVPPGSADGAALTVDVDHVEVLGEPMDVVGFTKARQRIVARLPAREDVPGRGPIRLGIDLERAYPFEPGPFGRNLLG